MINVKSNPACIIPLNLRGSPSNVSRLISLFIVNSINRVFFSRALADLSIEFGKIIAPFWRYCYSSPTIVFKMLMIWVSTSLDYVLPRSVFFCSSHAVRCCVERAYFSMETAARLGISSFEVCIPNNSFCPTVANTQPHRWLFGSNPVFCSEPTVPNSTQIFCFDGHRARPVKSDVWTITRFHILQMAAG